MPTLTLIGMHICIMASFISVAVAIHVWQPRDQRAKLAAKLEALITKASLLQIPVKCTPEGIALDGGNYFVFVGGSDERTI